MNDIWKRLFGLGAALASAYLVWQCLMATSFLLPLEWSSAFPDVFHSGALNRISEAAAIVGLALLMVCRYQAAAPLEPGFRKLDRTLAFLLPLYLILAALPQYIFDLPQSHIGLAYALTLARHIGAIVLAICFAYALWHAHKRAALFLSLAYLVAYMLPGVPFNNPAMFEDMPSPVETRIPLIANTASAEAGEKPSPLSPAATDLSLSDTPRDASQEMPPTMEDVDSGIVIQRFVFIGQLIPFLMLAYAWLRFSPALYHREEH